MTITPAAWKQITRLLEQNPTATGMQIGVQGGGCSGMSYVFKLYYLTGAATNSTILINHRAIVIIDDKSAVLLKDVTLNYKETIMKQGFEFTNPAATRSCGCGKSFST